MNANLSGPVLLWVRRDLRVHDNPALAYAAARGDVVPVFVWNPAEDGGWPLGAAARVWLHHALGGFASELERRGSARLIIAVGSVVDTLMHHAQAVSARSIVWNRLYEPAAIAQSAALKRRAAAAGIEARSFASYLLNEPQAIKNRQGTPFKVFTAYWKHCTQINPQAPPLCAPASISGSHQHAPSLSVDALELLPRSPWHRQVLAGWTPSEAGAGAALERFAATAIDNYQIGRDEPALDGVSALSPYLHHGQISPRQIRARLSVGAGNGALSDGARAFERQLYWRDFAHYLLFHFPHMPSAPLNPAFAQFPWSDGRGDVGALVAWQRGETGYPLIDAGMRELWRTGTMHNRVRMNVASFLVKHLLVDWRVGQRWFWDTLFDASLANNSMGWQWAAGCGVDAAPYFRIFNPTLQAERFDSDGDYIRRWVPELARLDKRWIHQPSVAPAQVLAAAKVCLDKDYPRPIVDHREARAMALSALATIKKPS
jgi:deoxyribodipyrimidine photo-lyase